MWKKATFRYENIVSEIKISVDVITCKLNHAEKKIKNSEFESKEIKTS